MAWSNTQQVEWKELTILKILKESPKPLGSRMIARHLESYGFSLQERTVRYHLKLMDEKGFTRAGGRKGRAITDLGREELANALVSSKVGFVIDKIEQLTVQTTFDWEKRSGLVPVNVSFIPKDKFLRAQKAMSAAFRSGLCVSELVAVAQEGEKLAQTIVPRGKIGFATVCSIVVNGSLLKAGIPMDSKFAGLLQVKSRTPLRFVELIQYTGSSLDPSEIFLRSRMTSVKEAAGRGEGKILANFREIPAICRPAAQKVITGLKEANLGGILLIGETSQPVCEMAVALNKIGLILIGGLTPVAPAIEVGIEIDNSAMSGLMDYKDLVSFWQL